MLLREDLSAAVVAPDPEQVRVRGERLAAADAPEHGAYSRAGPAGPAALSPGFSERVMGGGGVNRYAPEAKRAPHRRHSKTPAATRETVTVEHFGHAASLLRPVDVEDPPADPDPVAGPHPAGVADLLRALAHGQFPRAMARIRSPWRKARSTTSRTSSGENAPISPFCMATTLPTSSVATVIRPWPARSSSKEGSTTMVS